MTAGRIAIVFGAVLAAACSAAVLPYYRGPRTDHFDGKHFFNEEPFEEQQPSELARCQLDRHRGSWPDSDAIAEPSHASAVVDATWPVRPHTPRGGTWTNASRFRHA